MNSLQTYVEHAYSRWAEGNPAAAAAQAVKVAEAMTELAADGITTVAQLKGFDLEGIWERD